jgi:4-amino-4-deoxy-L-arabinose transferase-like glycosyltransferase
VADENVVMDSEPMAGRSLPPAGGRRRHLACLAVISLLAFPVFLYDAGDREVCDIIDERVAVTSREMWRADEWILPTMNGEPRLQKPPLAYWLPQAFAILRGSFDETTLWLPFGLAAIACLFFTYGIGALLGGWRLGLLAACLLVMMPIFQKAGTTASADILLGLAAAGAWFFHLRARRGARAGWERLAFYACLGCGALAKGPVILVFTLLPILVEAAVTRSRAPLRPLRSLPGIGLFLLLSLAWPILVSLRLPGQPQGMTPTWQWLLETFGKMFASDGAEGDYRYLKHPEPWYFYLVRMVPLFGLGGLLLMASIARAIRRRIRRRVPTMAATDPGPGEPPARAGAPLALSPAPLVVWLLAGLAFFTLIVEKKGFYLLPLAPPAAILAAIFIDETFALWRPAVRPLAWATAAASAAALALFTLAARRPELFEGVVRISGESARSFQVLFETKSAHFQLAAGMALAGSLVVGRLSLSRTAGTARPALAALAVAVTTTFAAISLPYREIHYADERSEWVGEDTRAVRSQIEPGQEVYGAGRLPAGLLFYLDHRIAPVASAAASKDLPAGSGFLVSEATLKREALLPPAAAAGEITPASGDLLAGYTLVKVINPGARNDRERVIYFEKRL